MMRSRQTGPLLACCCVVVAATLGMASAYAERKPTPLAGTPDCSAKVAIEGADATSLEVTLQCDPKKIKLMGFSFGERDARPFIEPISDSIGKADNSVDIDPKSGWWIHKNNLDTAPIFTTIHYRVDLDNYARQSADYDAAIRSGRSVLINVSHWLAVPELPEDESSAVMAVSVTAKDGAKSALPMPQFNGTYRILSADIPFAGTSVFGQFDRRQIIIPGPGALLDRNKGQNITATIDLVQLDEKLTARPDQIAAWVEDSARVVGQYWHGFPVEHVLTVILPVDRPGVPYGRVIADGGATALILVGKKTEPASLYQEWVLVHELIHLGSPYIRDTGAWFNEGIATYVEPIVRARAGWKTEDAVWQEWMDGMTKGTRAMGPIGLKEAGRAGVYWGGALFMLTLDIEMRRQTKGALGLEDCLGNILLSGNGDIRRTWKTDNAVNWCDQISGKPIMKDLVAHYVGGADPIDLDKLWKNLGLARNQDGKIVYDDSAPLAAIRKQIVGGGKTSQIAQIPVTQRP